MQIYTIKTYRTKTAAPITQIAETTDLRLNNIPEQKKYLHNFVSLPKFGFPHKAADITRGKPATDNTPPQKAKREYKPTGTL
ncbi:MAG: hypothetical protein IAC54_00495 [Bacteroidetes bacterium]|uniref:Uncharacterized protein n=1 Tax=Candidatus Caccoplasma merdipullorum TaxID=2840718 RepID=A0A9D9E3Q1_9BACT|nr:hypothetical protein [Candidatus Caccoplasma merdipullorum]